MGASAILSAPNFALDSLRADPNLNPAFRMCLPVLTEAQADKREELAEDERRDAATWWDEA